MGPLSDIFGGEENSNNTNDSNGSLTGDLDAALGLDLSSSSESYSQDEDGNVSADSTDNSLSLDQSTDGLLSGVTDNFASSSDSDSGN